MINFAGSSRQLQLRSKAFMCKWQIGILSGEDFFTILLKISVLNNATHTKIFIWINLKVTRIDYFLNLYEWDTKEQIVKNDI